MWLAYLFLLLVSHFGAQERIGLLAFGRFLLLPFPCVLRWRERKRKQNSCPLSDWSCCDFLFVDYRCFPGYHSTDSCIAGSLLVGMHEFLGGLCGGFPSAQSPEPDRSACLVAVLENLGRFPRGGLCRALAGVLRQQHNRFLRWSNKDLPKLKEPY